MTIKITDKAAEKVRQSIIKRGRGKGIRIGVKTMGCSGLAYILEYVDEESLDLVKMCINNVFVFVAHADLPYVENVSVDYVKRGLNEGFEFINPLEKDRCGCGTSFRV